MTVVYGKPWSDRNLLLERMRAYFSRRGVTISSVETYADIEGMRRRYMAVAQWQPAYSLLYQREVIEFTDDISEPDLLKLISVKLRLAGCSSISPHNA